MKKPLPGSDVTWRRLLTRTIVLQHGPPWGSTWWMGVDDFFFFAVYIFFLLTSHPFKGSWTVRMLTVARSGPGPYSKHRPGLEIKAHICLKISGLHVPRYLWTVLGTYLFCLAQTIADSTAWSGPHTHAILVQTHSPEWDGCNFHCLPQPPVPLCYDSTWCNIFPQFLIPVSIYFTDPNIFVENNSYRHPLSSCCLCTRVSDLKVLVGAGSFNLAKYANISFI